MGKYLTKATHSPKETHMVCFMYDKSLYKSKFGLNNFIFSINYRKYFKMLFINVMKLKKGTINTTLQFFLSTEIVVATRKQLMKHCSQRYRDTFPSF